MLDPAVIQEYFTVVMLPDSDLPQLGRMLDARPALVHAVTEKDVTGLMLAVMEFHPDVAALLLDRGADINAVDFEGSTALRWAVDDRNDEAVRLLLDRGADWSIADRAGVTPYDKAHRMGCDGIVAAIEARMAAGPPPGRDAPPPKKALDIIVAAAHGKRGELRQIVADNPDSPRWREPVTGATALRNVVVYGALGVEDAAFLLAHGADLDAQDADGRTALMHAVDRPGPSPFTDLFIAGGADPLLKDMDGATAADIARSRGNPDLTKILGYELERSVAGTHAPLRLRKPLVLKR